MRLQPIPPQNQEKKIKIQFPISTLECPPEQSISSPRTLFASSIGMRDLGVMSARLGAQKKKKKPHQEQQNKQVQMEENSSGKGLDDKAAAGETRRSSKVEDGRTEE